MLHWQVQELMTTEEERVCVANTVAQLKSRGRLRKQDKIQNLDTRRAERELQTSIPWTARMISNDTSRHTFR